MSSEKDAVKQVAGELGLEFQKAQTAHGSFVNLGTIGLSRVLLVETDMGPFSATGSAAKALEWLRLTQAQAIIGLGMAFGALPEQQRAGDVIVATSILPYDYKIVRCGAGATPAYDYSQVKTYPAREQLVALFRRAALDANCRDRVHFGPLLSGGSRIHCASHRDELVAAFPDRGLVVGGDMEGIGLLTTSDETESRWIVVKGISDFGDHERDAIIAKTRPRACYASARFVLSALLAEESLRAQHQ